MRNMESGTPTQDEFEYSPTPQSSAQELRQQRLVLFGIIAFVIIFLGLTIFAVWYLVQDSSPTARIRDVFIIFMALESLFLGVALIILIIQIARLINLLQNEIKPILESTNETVSTLRGTTTFLSNNMVEPVIKANEYMAGLRQALTVIGLARGGPKKK